MKKYILSLLFVTLSLALLASDKVKGYVRDTKKQPVAGATVYWENTQIGTTTQADGSFEIETPAAQTPLVVSYIGYISETVSVKDATKELNITLKEDSKILKEVIVVQRGSGTVAQRKALVQTQKITMGEIRRDACCNLGESFTSNPSVDVAYTDATTGAKQIKLLGLAGTYVQMLTENYPNFRGAAASFGMDYIPGPWMEGIYVSKGTSSVKNGYEALAGQINVEYKKPQMMDKFSINLFGSDAMRMEASADGSIHFNDNVQSALFAHYSGDAQGHDQNNDGFLDFPKTQQFNLMNRWNHISGNYVAQYGIKYIHENREGGQDTQHHSFANPYRISLTTNRGEFYTKQAYSTVTEDNLMTSLALIASASLHDQKSSYDIMPYNIFQKNVYLSLIYEKEFSHAHSLSMGLSTNYDGFKEEYGNAILNTAEITPGAYAQYTYNWNDKVILLGGFRADYSGKYGFFLTPRFHLKYQPEEWFHLRASIGKGFRTPHVLAENNFLLASSRKVNIANDLKQEEAWNTGVNTTFYIPIYDEKQITLSAEFYHTRFLHQVVVDVDSDPHSISFYNLDGRKSYSNSAQVEITYPAFEGFSLTAAYRYTRSMSDFRNPVTGEVRFMNRPLMNDYKGLITASYQTPLKKWQFDATAQFNGGGRMPTPDVQNPLWEERFKPFTVVNSQITKYFRNWSLYVGAENLFDFHQMNPIVDAANPRSENFDATMIWGPVHGRKIYAGFRFNIPRF